MPLILILVFIAIYCYSVVYGSRGPLYILPPGPILRLPILGNALQVGTNLSKGFNRMRQQYGDIFALYIGKRRTVVVSDYDLIQEVGHSLSFNHRKWSESLAELRGGGVHNGKELTTPGIVQSSGKNWHEQRKFLSSRLRSLGVGKQSMERLICDEFRLFHEHISKSNGQPVDIRTNFNLAVMNSLWTVVAGERLEYDDSKVNQLVELMDQMFRQLGDPMTGVIFFCKPLFRLLKNSNVKTIHTVVNQLIKFMEEMVDEHKATLERDNLRDFTDHYLKEMEERSKSNAESSFKGEEGHLNMINVLLDIFIAGSETTSTALNWAMFYMIQNPDIQKKVQEELSQAVGEGCLPTLSDRPNTPYTEAVIHEVLRCGNAVPLSVVHTASEDAHLRKFFIPAKTNIYLNFERVHTDPDIFPNPEKFDPTRYLSKEGAFRPHSKVIPFGVGKRKCLGEALAKTTMYLFFTGIMTKFDLTKAHQSDYLTSEPLLGRTLSPYPYKMRFIPRS